MASLSKPTFLLVCGGWHAPACYDRLKEQLEARGYDYICPRLASMGKDASGVTYEADVEVVRKAALELFEQGREVMLLAHSAGGVPAVVATKGLEVSKRAEEGKRGGFSGIIFIAAVVIPQHGMDTLTTLGGKWHPAQGGTEPYTKGHLMTLGPGAELGLYSDLPAAEAATFAPLFAPHSQDAFETPVDYIATEAQPVLPLTYIVTEQDMAFPPDAQRALAASVPGMRVESIATSHSPFASQPARLAEMVIEIAESRE